MRVSVQQMVALLEDFAAVLQPFTSAAGVRSRAWDGTEYAPVLQPHGPDPHALAWWATLRAVASLLRSQPRITQEQYSYLHSEWFGGMGSLNDFVLDTERHGEAAKKANERLDRIRVDLYSCLQSLQPHAESKT
jgi:hypothetical protein